MADGYGGWPIDSPSSMTISHQPSAICINPVRARSRETRPENGEPGGAHHEGQSFLPPRAVPAAEFDPPRWKRERKTDEDGEWTPPDQPEKHAPDTTQCHREIA
jgi:hypothetical protein